MKSWKALFFVIVCLFQVNAWAAPKFMEWDIQQTQEKWNGFAKDFLPNFQISECESAGAKNDREGFNCSFVDAEGAGLIVSTLNGKTEFLWLLYNTDSSSLISPTDVWRAPALLTKMARNVPYGDHISFVKKIVFARNKGDKEVCEVDTQSDSKVCGDKTSTGFEFTIIKN